ncbi:hypothetical protein D3C81_2025500 [compost metagenome]
MCESRRIDQNEVHAFAARRVDTVDQFVLGIALQVLQVMAGGACALLQVLVDLGQGHGAIDARFAGAEQVQVGAVEHQ